MSLIIEKYNSIIDFKKAFERPINSVFEHAALSSQEKGNAKFRGTNSFDDALHQLETGRNTVISELKKDVERLEYTGTSFKTIRKNDFSGYAPNVGRALAGLPRDMRSKKKVYQPVKTITLVYSCCVGWTVKQEDLDKAGRAFFRLAYRLEQSGIKTSIFVLPFCVNNDVYKPSESMLSYVKLKDFSGRFDLTRLSFPLTSPSMLRRFGLRLLETTPNLTNYRKYTDSYGTVMDKSDIEKNLKSMPEFKKDFKLFSAYDFIECGFDETKVFEEITKKKA